MKAGNQLAQVAHVMSSFAIEHSDVHADWQTNSNYLVILSVEDEISLSSILEKARELGIKTSSFIEPDLGDQLTAIALEPSEETYRITSSLPLALKELSVERKEVSHVG